MSYHNYLETRILTASPEQLVVIMYEEAVGSLIKAKKAMENNDFETANKQLSRAQNIVAELMSSLDFTYEDIANNLFTIYRHIYNQIVKANAKKDKELVSDIEKLLSLFAAAWKEAAKRVTTELLSQVKSSISAY